MIGVRRVSGHSMEPLLSEGRTVFVWPSGLVKVGDLVVAEVEGREVIKLVGDMNSDFQAYLKGGQGQHDIGWIDVGQIRGRVLWPKLDSEAILN